MKSVVLDKLGDRVIMFRNKNTSLSSIQYPKITIFEAEYSDEGIVYPAKSLSFFSKEEVTKLRDFLTKCLEEM